MSKLSLTSLVTSIMTSLKRRATSLATALRGTITSSRCPLVEIEIVTEKPRPKTAIEFVKMLRDDWSCCPRSKEGAKLDMPTNGELNRWFKKKCVLINGVKPDARDEITYPITELVFFPKNNKSRCTIR